MTKKLSKIWLTLIAVVMVLGLAMPSQDVSARGFSGGHTSFHSTYHATPTRSYHAPSRSYHTTRYRVPNSYHAPSTSYHTSRYRTPKSYHVNRYPSSHYNTNRHSSIASEFGHSIVRGAGWSIGSNMGNSIWHQTFGFGGDRYIDNNGQVQYAKPGHSGWVLIVIILAIIAIVIAIRRANHRDYHHY